MTAGVVGVLAEALAQHRPVGFGKCHCGWFTVTELGLSWREKHEAHVASVVAALPNIAIVDREHVAEARQWDGTRASIHGLCRWANNEGDPMDDATLTYTYSRSDDVSDVNFAGPAGYKAVTAGDWIVRTANGEFLLARGDLAARAAGGQA